MIFMVAPPPPPSRIDLISVHIMVPKLLKKAIVNRAQAENATMSDIYHRALREFVSQLEGATARSQFGTVTFLAPYRKGPNVLLLQMWLERDLFTSIDRLAKRAHISRPAFCYTALRASFPND